MFKVSVLGAKSFGKSTSLNTVFKLNFPVSIGRCNGWPFTDLVRVNESSREVLRCNYIAVIDSEGLMSRALSRQSDYDNELSSTARKRSLRRLCFYRCVSVHGGGMRGCLGWGACMVAGGACMVAGGACVVARGHVWLWGEARMVAGGACGC